MIKVRTTTGHVELGGQFQDALAFVKDIKGRKYDASTKTWSVPLPAKEFAEKASCYHLPLDFEQVHQTSYGNKWDAQEWKVEKSVWDAQAKISADPEALKAIRESAQEQFAQIGITDERLISFLLANIWNEGKVCAHIQFTSARRKEQVLSILRWVGETEGGLYMEIEDRKEAVRERMYEEFGIE